MPLYISPQYVNILQIKMNNMMTKYWKSLKKNDDDVINKSRELPLDDIQVLDDSDHQTYKHDISTSPSINIVPPSQMALYENMDMDEIFCSDEDSFFHELTNQEIELTSASLLNYINENTGKATNMSTNEISTKDTLPIQDEKVSDHTIEINESNDEHQLNTEHIPISEHKHNTETNQPIYTNTEIYLKPSANMHEEHIDSGESEKESIIPAAEPELKTTNHILDIKSDQNIIKIPFEKKKYCDQNTAKKRIKFDDENPTLSISTPGISIFILVYYIKMIECIVQIKTNQIYKYI